MRIGNLETSAFYGVINLRGSYHRIIENESDALSYTLCCGFSPYRQFILEEDTDNDRVSESISFQD